MNKFLIPVLLTFSCLFACQAEIPAPGGELAGLYHTWTLVGIETDNKWEDVPSDLNDMTLALDAELRASLSTDCNQGGGTYTVDPDGSIDFNAGALTNVYCGEFGDKWERLFLISLEAVDQFSLADDELWLWNDDLSLRFER
ncbi:MAG: META domain-containing protein [Bacteroidia bacterium]